jgi:NAD(P)-dependent dehydrogenase (short-subunit alcohol dehydrogenase family)
VVVADLDLDAARKVEAGLPDGSGRHFALMMDVTNRPSVDEAVAQAVDEFGGLDVVVNVAGGDTTHGVFEETGDEIWLRLLELNLVGVARVCRAAVPLLRGSDRAPAIVIVSSINAHVALGSEPYSSAKAGLAALTRNLALYLAPDGVRVNAVAPGTIRTRVWQGQEGGAERMKPLYPWAGSVSRKTWPERSYSWPPPTPPGSPVTHCLLMADYSWLTRRSRFLRTLPSTR